jgi:hypothetical protein
MWLVFTREAVLGLNHQKWTRTNNGSCPLLVKAARVVAACGFVMLNRCGWFLHGKPFLA